MAKPVYFEDMEIGHVEWSDEITADEEAMIAYAQEFDPLPFHIDAQAAESSPYGKLIASGGYTIGLWYKMMHNIRQRRASVFLGALEWNIRFVRPVCAGDRLRLKQTTLEKRDTTKSERGLAVYRHEIFNQDDECMLRMVVTGLVAKRATHGG